MPLAAPLPSPLDPATMRWGIYRFKKFGLTVPLLAGVRPSEGEMGGNLYLRQKRYPIEFAIWVGQGRTLESWRGGFTQRKGAKLSEPVAGPPVCGKPSTIQEISLEKSKEYVGRPMALSKTANPELRRKAAASPDINFGPRASREIPARTMRVLAFRVKDGTDALAGWTVVTEKRQEYAIHEDHFFASLKCD